MRKVRIKYVKGTWEVTQDLGGFFYARRVGDKNESVRMFAKSEVETMVFNRKVLD